LCTDSNQTDITGAAITFQIKDSIDESATILVEKQNTAAGGGSDEIEDVDLSIGSFRVKIDAVDTINFTEGYYYCEAKAVISTKPYVLFLIKIKLLDALVS